MVPCAQIYTLSALGLSPGHALGVFAGCFQRFFSFRVLTRRNFAGCKSRSLRYLEKLIFLRFAWVLSHSSYALRSLVGGRTHSLLLFAILRPMCTPCVLQGAISMEAPFRYSRTAKIAPANQETLFSSKLAIDVEPFAAQHFFKPFNMAVFQFVELVIL